MAASNKVKPIENDSAIDRSTRLEGTISSRSCNSSGAKYLLRVTT